ncbi:metallophosphoesterase family protein [Flavisolibacter nicotianae]|uniref:metallophosphoesterase family protein n=1 Tax=Flavisolibacter nicotianae TaxID=2364882 RepID=UPI000EAEEEC1|nr:metallophosphoesterase [Flavisolibacter nicotianae]
MENLSELQTTSQNVLAFVSDTQAPMLVETILLKSHNNRKATERLFTDVLERTPAAIFHLGDVVNLGYSGRQWRPIDRYLEALRLAKIPVHGILGNHEVMGRPVEGQRKFQQRFPDHDCTGYLVRYDTVAVVLLNSNFKVMTPQQDRKQQEWLQATLHELDGDATVMAIIVCCHHSPFTNSRIVRPSKEVEQKFVPAYLSSRKAVLFLSGHCHAFEHYKVKGKDFLVIGGGGGLRQPLRQGLGTLADLSPAYKPMFHYITVTSLGESLSVTSYHIKKDFTGFEEGIKLEMKKG